MQTIIYLTNLLRYFYFSTYDSVQFYPSAYLNIIIGPNGTGKSTLIAGIVLGLGGKPQVLSRASNVSFEGIVKFLLSVRLQKILLLIPFGKLTKVHIL